MKMIRIGIWCNWNTCLMYSLEGFCCFAAATSLSLGGTWVRTQRQPCLTHILVYTFHHLYFYVYLMETDTVCKAMYGKCQTSIVSEWSIKTAKLVSWHSHYYLSGGAKSVSPPMALSPQAVRAFSLLLKGLFILIICNTNDAKSCAPCSFSVCFAV